jgi:hypothetical protein
MFIISRRRRTKKKEGRKMNLAKLTASRYKISLDESWYHERSEVRSADRIWYERIHCKKGAVISVYSLDSMIFQLWTDRVKNARIVWGAIKDAPGVQADFHFDSEAVLRFPLELLQQVAEMAGARRKRRLSEEEKSRLAEVGKVYRFKRINYGANEEENVVDLDVSVFATKIPPFPAGREMKDN